MLQHPIAMIRDTARYRAYMKSHGKDGGKLRPRRLKDLAKEVLGLEIQEGKHDSVSAYDEWLKGKWLCDDNEWYYITHICLALG